MNTKTKNYLIALIAVIGLVLAASAQAKTAPGRGRSSVGSRHSRISSRIGGRQGSLSRGRSSIGGRHGSISGGHSSFGNRRGSLGGSHITIGSRHSGISFRLGFGGSGLHYRASIVPRLGHIYRRPVILPRPVVIPAPTVTVWISNANGSQSPVVLTQDGPWYIGPRGERYFGIPTAEQLRVFYGLGGNTVAVASSDVVVYIIAANGVSIPVKLTATEDGYIGPNGELYIEMPTEQQLRMIYGK